MQFCTDCGGVLNLFGNNTSSLCSSCIQHRKEPLPPKAVSPKQDDDVLADSILCVENGKIILRSKEGWQLWSASVESKTELASVMKAAKLIYTIRKRRKKKK